MLRVTSFHPPRWVAVLCWKSRLLHRCLTQVGSCCSLSVMYGNRSFIELVEGGILVLLLFRAGQVQECKCAGYCLTWYQCQSSVFEFQFRRAVLGDTNNVDVFLQWTTLWFSDCPASDRCQDSWSGLSCPFITYNAHAEGCAPQSIIRGAAVLFHPQVQELQNSAKVLATGVHFYSLRALKSMLVFPVVMP